MYALKRRHEEDLVLLALVLPAFLFIGGWPGGSIHYLLFVYPTLALLSAVVLTATASCLAAKKLAVAGLLVGFLFRPFCMLVVDAWTQVSRSDSRRIAYQWIQEHVPAGRTLVRDWAYLPPLPSRRDILAVELHKEDFSDRFLLRLRHTRSYRVVHLPPPPEKIGLLAGDYLITSSGCYARFFSQPMPLAAHPLAAVFRSRKDFYARLLGRSEGMGWRRIKSFDTGKGPRVLIFQRLGQQPSP